MQFRIKELRKANRMSQEELSEKSGVSRTIVSFLENGNETDTKVGTLLKIAEALEVPLTALFSDNKNLRPEAEAGKRRQHREKAQKKMAHQKDGTPGNGGDQPL